MPLPEFRHRRRWDAFGKLSPGGNFLRGEDPLHLGSGAGQAVVALVLIVKVCEGQEGTAVVGEGLADFVGGQPGGVDVAVHADQGGQGHGQVHNLVVQPGGYVQGVVPAVVNGQHIGDVGQAQIFRHLRAHLGGVAVGGLLAAEDQVEFSALADALGDGVGRSQDVGTGKFPVRQHGTLFGTHAHRFLNDGLSLGRAHGQGFHTAAEPLGQFQSGFDGVQVIGVDLAGNTASFQHAGDRIHFHIVGTGHLLDTDKDFHNIPPEFWQWVECFCLYSNMDRKKLQDIFVQKYQEI